MLKQTAFAFILPAAAALAVAAHTQAPVTGHATMGKNHFAYGSIKYVPSETIFSSGVVLTAPDYDLTALTVHVFEAPVNDEATDKDGPEAVSKIVADADLAHGKQVIGHFKQVPARTPAGAGRGPTSVDHGRYYTVYADHAVYAPDNSRLDKGTLDSTDAPTATDGEKSIQTGTLDLSGHPKIIVRAPDALQEPSTTTFNDPAANVHVLLGRGPDYPQVEGPAGQTDFTPLR